MISTRTHIIDIVYSLTITLFIPSIFLIGISILFIISNSLETSLMILISINIVFFFMILIYYRIQYKILFNYAMDVGYLHFKPSVKDIMLGFYGNIFSVLIMILVVLFIFDKNAIEQLSLADFMIFSFVFASIYQFLSVIFVTRAKIKLISTSMEKLDSSLLERVKNIPGSESINEYRYADIKPASLFLTAGVTKFSGYKNICLVSRYFQWKLSEDELYAVISHEVGHVKNNDLTTNFFILNIDYLLRTFYYTSILFALSIIISNGFSFNGVLLIINVGIVMVSSLLIRFILQYRMYTQEIKSDEYGSRIVGNYVMANTLKKLPSAIPAPVNDNPLEFLGFRVAILKNRGKKLNEPILQPVRQFSRFSNN